MVTAVLNNKRFPFLEPAFPGPPGQRDTVWFMYAKEIGLPESPVPCPLNKLSVLYRRRKRFKDFSFIHE
jgi:hypothetical protein